MSIDDKKLDNPVWHSLSETHRRLAIDYSNIKFYHPEYCPFGGFTSAENMSGSIDDYASGCNNFFVVGEKPVFSNSIKLKNELVCLQMVVNSRIDLQIREDIVEIGPAHT